MIVPKRTQVIKEKKAVYEKNFGQGKAPTPSLSQIIASDYNDEASSGKSKQQQQNANKSPTSVVQQQGLRDDLDDIDENDIGN